MHAPRLDSLENKTICELSNSDWGYDRIFPAIRDQLKARVPTLRVVPYDEIARTRPELDNLEQISRALAERGCQGVIAGMAG